MRTLSRFITLLLCLELIVAPVQPGLSFMGQVAHAQQDCGPGMQFDSTLNRCLTKTQTANVINATMSCAKDDVECYKRNAQSAFQDKVNAGEAPERKGNSKFNSVIQIAAIAGPVTIAGLGLSTSTASCLSPSFYAMVAAAAAIVIGDNWANLDHKKRLKKIKEEWGEIVNPEQANGNKDKERETSIEAQSEAFEKLAQAEDSLAQAAKKKRTFFLIGTAAYGAAAVMALMEKKKSAAIKAAATAAAAAASSANATSATVNPASAPAATAANAAQSFDAQLAAAQAAIDSAQQAASTVVTPPAAGASAVAPAASGSATSLALKAKATAAQKVATATAAVKAATAAQATASGLAATDGGAALALANTALATANTMLTTANQEMADANASLCTAMGVTAYSPSQVPTSLYSYYTNGYMPDIRGEIQSLYNLENSKDMASFVMNKKELDGQFATVEEYSIYKEEFSEIESVDNTAFEFFKAASLSIIKNLNPITSAHAREDQMMNESDSRDSFERTSDEGNSSGSRATGPRSTRGAQNSDINTNAAKAYKEDEAKGINLLNIGLGIGAGYLLAVKTGIREKLVSPTGRAVFSGVMAGLTFMMAQHAKSQADASEKRAELLRKMKEEFNKSAGAVFACGSEDRNDPGKPNCYCYTSENARNPNRGSSQVCQNLWAGKSLNATNYLAKGNTNSRICISNQNKADPTCACKQTGTCMKVGVNGISGFNPGTMSVLSSSLAPLNGIANGSIDAANVDAAGLENAAARVRKLKEEMEKKGLGVKNGKALEEKLKRDLAKAAGTLPSGSLLGSSSSSNMPSNPGDAARMLEKELENSNTPTGIGGGGNFLAAPINAQPEPGFEFGMTQDQLAAQESQIAEVMQQDLDYGTNDINQGSNANIFDVLSNRYQRSGMRRLFDEDGKTKADAPAKSDIIQ